MLCKYERRGYRVTVEARSEIISEINSFVKDFFSIKEISRTEIGSCWHIMLIHEKNNLGFETERLLIEQPPEPEIKIFFNGKRKFVGLLAEYSNEWQVQNILRLIRVILRFECGAANTYFLHGGCVDYKKNGICFLGEKKSGKTSSILGLLKEFETSFITNDDVSIYRDGDTWYGEGWPRSIVIRKDTWDILNLNYSKESSRHPLNTYLKKGHCLYPQQLCDLFNRKLSSVSKIKYLIFPKFSNDELTFRKIDRTESRERIFRNLQYNPGKYNEYLLSYFNMCKLNDSELDDFLNQVECFELIQPFNRISDGVKLIIDFIENEYIND